VGQLMQSVLPQPNSDIEVSAEFELDHDTQHYSCAGVGIESGADFEGGVELNGLKHLHSLYLITVTRKIQPLVQKWRLTCVLNTK